MRPTFEKWFSPENELPEPVALGFPEEQCRQHPAHLPPSKALESISINHQMCKTPWRKTWNGGVQPGKVKLEAPVTNQPCVSVVTSGHTRGPAEAISHGLPTH